MSSWFGGSGSSDRNTKDTGPKDFSSSEEQSYPTASNMMNPMGGGGGALQELQQFQIMIQQSLLVQEVIGELTELSFEKCITGKPNDQLTGKEVACTHSVVGKWLDTNEFMNGRLAKKQQQSTSGY